MKYKLSGKKIKNYNKLQTTECNFKIAFFFLDFLNTQNYNELNLQY